MEQQDTELASLLEANLKFYEGFSTLDIAAMDGIWEPSERTRCMHPGWPLITGWTQVRQSWENIFNNTTMMHFIITEAQPVIQGDIGWVDCIENVTSLVDGRAASFAARSTNIFAKAPITGGESLGGQWLMVHHHASP